MTSPETLRKHHCYLRADFYDETSFLAPAEGPKGWYPEEAFYVCESMASRPRCQRHEGAQLVYEDPELGQQWEAYCEGLEDHMNELIRELEEKALALGLSVEFKNCERPYIKSKKFRPVYRHDHDRDRATEEKLVAAYMDAKRNRGELIQDEDFALLWNCHNPRHNKQQYGRWITNRPDLTESFSVLGDRENEKDFPRWFGRCKPELAQHTCVLWAAILELMGGTYDYENMRLEWGQSPHLEGYEHEMRRW